MGRLAMWALARGSHADRAQDKLANAVREDRLAELSFAPFGGLAGETEHGTT